MPDNPLAGFANPEPGIQAGDVAAWLGSLAFGGGTGTEQAVAPAQPATPVNGTANGMYMGCQIKVPIAVKTIAKAPRGYVVVTDPQTGQKIGMLKKAARACGLWKPRSRPPISAKDWKSLRGAARVVNKMKTVQDRVDTIQKKATRRPKKR